MCKRNRPLIGLAVLCVFLAQGCDTSDSEFASQITQGWDELTSQTTEDESDYGYEITQTLEALADIVRLWV